MQRLSRRTARLPYRASVRSGRGAGRIIEERIHQLTFELSAEDVFVLLNTVLRGTFQRTQKDSSREAACAGLMRFAFSLGGVARVEADD